jgi:hypothetical protein
VDGIITLPIAIAAFFVLPDLPENTKAKYLTAEVGTSVYDTTSGMLTRSSGDQNEPSSNGSRRASQASALHKGEAQEDLHVMALVGSRGMLCVSFSLFGLILRAIENTMLIGRVSFQLLEQWSC